MGALYYFLLELVTFGLIDPEPVQDQADALRAGQRAGVRVYAPGCPAGANKTLYTRDSGVLRVGHSAAQTTKC